jgi:hypothetical protein
MSVEWQKISGFLLFLVMKYVYFITRNRRKSLIFCSSTDILHHKEQEKTTDLLQFH